jgi:hypothetical protein
VVPEGEVEDMYITSHPWMMLVIAVVLASVVGTVLKSMTAAVLAFYVFMFLLIVVATWIFGSPVYTKPY